MSINQKRGRQTFRRRFVSRSLFSPLLAGMLFTRQTKTEPDLRLGKQWKCGGVGGGVGGKTKVMWGWWWWCWRESIGNVVVVEGKQ